MLKYFIHSRWFGLFVSQGQPEVLALESFYLFILFLYGGFELVNDIDELLVIFLNSFVSLLNVLSNLIYLPQLPIHSVRKTLSSTSEKVNQALVSVFVHYFSDVLVLELFDDLLQL